MRVQIIAMGDRMPSWVEQGYDEYTKRIGAGINIELTEISPEKRGKSADIQRIMQKETEQMRQSIRKGHYVIALDKDGKQWSTEKLAEKIAGWQQDGTNISFLVGGPEGMTPELIKQADARVSFSAMTFPHPLVRIILAEQLYRAYSILNHHPYHK